MRYVDVYTAFKDRFGCKKPKINKKETDILSNILNYKESDNLNYTVFTNDKTKCKIYINMSSYDGCIVEFKEFNNDTSEEYSCAFININDKTKDISFLTKSNIVDNAFYRDANCDYEMDSKPVFYAFIANNFSLEGPKVYFNLGFQKEDYDPLLKHVYDQINHICTNSANMVYEYFDKYKLIKLTNQIFNV